MRQKFRLGSIAMRVLGRAANPLHLRNAIALQLKRKATRRSRDDAELQLIARMLPSGFLHYGYFDDPNRDPAGISMADVFQAQHRYAELLAEQVTDNQSPVLDVGCGMGGMVRLMQSRGFPMVALTPDRTQVQFMQRTFPDVPIYHCKFEEIEPAEHAGRYGTVITSESLQYLKLDAALPLLRSILKPGGRWVLCDYFRIAESAPPTNGNGRPGKPLRDSGHLISDFRQRIEQAGWQVAYERDITAHVLPTLKCLHLLATSFGIPFVEFVFAKLRRKNPGLHYLAQDAMAEILSSANSHLDVINPDIFAANKRYLLMTLTRPA